MRTPKTLETNKTKSYYDVISTEPLPLANPMKRSLASSFQGPPSTSQFTSSAKQSAQAALQHNKKARFSYKTMANLSIHPKRHKVTVVGSGNWYVTFAASVVANTDEK